MSRPDRDKDWKDRGIKQTQDLARRRGSELRAMQRAALSATQVTGDEHWDLFLSVINAKVESLQERMQIAVDRLGNSDNFSTEALINEKLTVRLLGREIEALRWVMELPGQLMEDGQRAKELLENAAKSPD